MRDLIFFVIDTCLPSGKGQIEIIEMAFDGSTFLDFLEKYLLDTGNINSGQIKIDLTKKVVLYRQMYV